MGKKIPVLMAAMAILVQSGFAQQPAVRRSAGRPPRGRLKSIPIGV